MSLKKPDFEGQVTSLITQVLVLSFKTEFNSLLPEWDPPV